MLEHLLSLIAGGGAVVLSIGLGAPLLVAAGIGVGAFLFTEAVYLAGKTEGENEAHNEDEEEKRKRDEQEKEHDAQEVIAQTETNGKEN